MKKYILLFLMPLLFVGFKIKAQDSLGVSHYNYYQSSNDTVAAGSLDSTGVWIVNRSSSTTFTGNLVIHTAVQDSSFLSFHEVDTVDFGPQIIAPGDSMQFGLHPNYVISPLKYHYDINVIVIWPVASFVSPAIDSLMFTEVIRLPNGISVLDLSNYIKVYPNPTTDKLIIESGGKNIIEEVRIYDSSGQLIRIIHNESLINTENWSNGMYIIDVTTVNGKRQRLKVLKQ